MSPLGLSVLIYKIDIDLNKYGKVLFRDLVVLQTPFSGLLRESDVLLAFRKRVAYTPSPSSLFQSSGLISPGFDVENFSGCIGLFHIH